MEQKTQNNLFDAEGGKNKSGGDTTSLFVSLYLIILAFFMVLNSISNQSQTKIVSATESVSRAFDNPFAPEADFIDVAETEDTLLPNDEFYEQLQGVFASLIGFEGRFPTQGGNVIRVEFNQSDIYEEDSPIFRDDQRGFFFQLARFLQNESIGTIREVEYMIYSGDNPPSGPAYWEDLSILRAGVIVERLKTMGVRENQLSIGVATGEEDKIKVSFFIRDAVSSRQSLEEADRQGLGEQSAPIPQGDG